MFRQLRFELVEVRRKVLCGDALGEETEEGDQVAKEGQVRDVRRLAADEITLVLLENMIEIWPDFLPFRFGKIFGSLV